MSKYSHRYQMQMRRHKIFRWLDENGYSESDMLPDGDSGLSPKPYINVNKPKSKPKMLNAHWHVNQHMYGCEYSVGKRALKIFKNTDSDISNVSCATCRKMLFRAFKDNTKK